MNLQTLRKIAPGAESISNLVNVPRKTLGQRKITIELLKDLNTKQNQNNNNFANPDPYGNSNFNNFNQAQNQQYNQALSAGQFGNQNRQQYIAEEAQRRNMPLNEMNALLSGQQVGMPSMPSFQTAGVGETPNLLGAAQMSYNSQMDAYNAQQAQGAGVMGGLFDLGAGYLSGGGSFGFGG